MSKADPRVEAYGEVDEASAAIGLARALGLDSDLDSLLARAQQDLFAIGARLADPARKLDRRVDKAGIGPGDVVRLEEAIDRLETELPPLRRFIAPGGSPPGAALHLARAICRRAERRIVSLPGVEPELLAYVNRLSDLLFVAARVVNRRAGKAEVEW